MSICKNNNNPVEFLLATSNSKLYDAVNGKWLWSGQLYWGIDCLPSSQFNTPDNVKPNLTLVPITKSPETWDFCKSNCYNNSYLLLIVFTFKPDSKDARDYLQYVLNIHCGITDYPKHTIMDGDGKPFYINIEEISKMLDATPKYVELWIDASTSVANTNLPDYTPAEDYTMIVFMIFVLIIFTMLMVGMFIYYNQRYRRYESKISGIKDFSLMPSM